MNNYWAFADMTVSNDLLGDREALRARLEDEGYLYFQGVIERDRILALRGEILEILAEHGWIAGGDRLADAVAVGMPVRETDEEYFSAYDERAEARVLPCARARRRLLSAVREALGRDGVPPSPQGGAARVPERAGGQHPTAPGLLEQPGHPALTAAWIPLGDCPMKQGTLAHPPRLAQLRRPPAGVQPRPGNTPGSRPERDARPAHVGHERLLSG